MPEELENKMKLLWILVLALVVVALFVYQKTRGPAEEPVKVLTQEEALQKVTTQTQSPTQEELFIALGEEYPLAEDAVIIAMDREANPPRLNSFTYNTSESQAEVLAAWKNYAQAKGWQTSSADASTLVFIQSNSQPLGIVVKPSTYLGSGTDVSVVFELDPQNPDLGLDFYR